MKLIYTVDKADYYKNINEILSLEFHISNRLATKLIKNKRIYKNHNIVNTKESVKQGDIISIDLSYDEDNSNILPKKIDLDIIFEDQWMLVINKPAGIAIHPSILHYDDSLSNGVRYYFDKIGLKKKIRPVNRLDFNTSGVVLFAKCEYIQEQLSEQMKNHIFKKEYLCLAENHFDNKKETIRLPISRKPDSIIERCIDEKGQMSITHYEVIMEFDSFSLVKCNLETGRTHQIRVHFAAIGHPLLGDTLYGKPSNIIDRQALHSYKINFIHPITKQQMEFISDYKDVFNMIFN